MVNNRADDLSNGAAQLLLVVAGICLGLFIIVSFRPGKLSSSLVVHLTFDDANKNNATFITNLVDGKKLQLRHGVIGKGKKGSGLIFTGHPDQGLILGMLDFQQPVTVALWIKRAAYPKLDTSGVIRPEYKQEHDLGKGRLLSPLSGNPSENSASLRIGPEKLEVWHATDHWTDLIPGPLPIEEWIHITVTFDEQLRATGYLNGQRKSTTHAAFNFNKSEVVLCGASLVEHYGFPFAGCIDDVRIYRGLLREKEIALLAGTRQGEK